MMTPDQIRGVGTVYRRLITAEEGRGWTKMDDSLCHLSNLDDKQLMLEAEVAFCHHVGKNPRCKKTHPIEECFIPTLLDAVGAIIDLNRESGSLHAKNRYIVECYLALDHGKAIVTD